MLHSVHTPHMTAHTGCTLAITNISLGQYASLYPYSPTIIIMIIIIIVVFVIIIMIILITTKDYPKPSQIQHPAWDPGSENPKPREADQQLVSTQLKLTLFLGHI